MIVFRADGSDKIGSGHLMRCMTIARELIERTDDSKEVLFVTALEESAEFVKSKGFGAVVLGKVELGEELPEIISFLEKEKPEWIFVDSYKATAEYLSSLRKYTKVVYMDDFGTCAYPVDMIVNYNVFAQKEHYAKLYNDSDTVCLVGSEYIPIRPEFSNQEYSVKSCLSDVLLLTGGGDYLNLSEKFLDTFGECEELKDLHFHLICGYYSDRMETLKIKARKYKNFTLYENVPNIWDLMKICDLALTAGGSTVYELCAIGVPFLGYSFADNQHPLMNYLKDKNITPCLGDYRERGQELLEDMIRHIAQCRSSKVREKMQMREIGFVDGCGAGRIVGALQRNAWRDIMKCNARKEKTNDVN